MAWHGYRVPMRWHDLFADLERQFDAALAAGLDDRTADLTRAERAGVALTDRLRAAVGSDLAVVVRSGLRLDGVLLDAAPTWLLLTGRGREHLVPVDAVVGVERLGVQAAPPPTEVVRRLGLAHALRGIARDRSLVRVHHVHAGTVDGRVQAVGADHLDLGVAHADSGRPSGELRTLTFSGLDVVSGL